MAKADKKKQDSTKQVEKRLARLEERMQAAVEAVEKSAKKARKAARELARQAEQGATGPARHGRDVVPSRVRAGEPVPGDLESKTRVELLQLAREADVTGRSAMSKQQLLETLRRG